MADAATALSPPSAPASLSPEQEVGQSVSAMQSDAAAEKAETQKDVNELDAIQQRTSGEVRSFDDIISTLKPPQLQEPPKLQPTQQTSAMQAWTSSAMLLAVIGSALSRRSLTTAMTSATAALNAFRAGDQAQANAAFTKWRIDTDNFWKVQQYQQDMYKDVLGQYLDREKIMADLGKEEIDTKLAEINAVGYALNHDQMAQAKSLDAALRIIEESDRLALMYAESGDRIITGQETQQAMKEWETQFRKDNGRPPTAAEKVTHLGEVRQSLGHQWNPQEINAATNNFDRQAAAYAKNSGYAGAQSNVSSILAFDLNRPPDKGEVIAQAAALDKFVQTINGNRAIRGFQLQLLQNDSGIYNKFQHAMQQLGQGGPVTRDMIAEMQKLATDYIHVATLNYGEFITRGQWSHWKLGVDPTLFSPPDYQPDKDPKYGKYPQPPDAAISALRAKPTVDNWVAFDEVFGQGAAAEVFAGQGAGG